MPATKQLVQCNVRIDAETAQVIEDLTWSERLSKRQLISRALHDFIASRGIVPPPELKKLANVA